MIADAKQAVQKAVDFWAQFLSEEQKASIRVDEVEFTSSDKEWHITLSISAPFHNLYFQLQPRDERVYKAFTVDAEMGSVSAMKIRVL